MLFPISDDDRSLAGPAYITHVFFWSNILIFLYQLVNPMFTYGFSAIPAEIMTGNDMINEHAVEINGKTIMLPQAPGPSPVYLTLISSMFMHGGFGHIAGNLLYLWIFGDNVEQRFGHLRFAVFYIVSGIIASLAQILSTPESVIPTLGASGAISGVMGAYLVLFPRNKVKAFFLFYIFSVPAIVVIGMWAVTQFVSGFGSITQTGESGGVAYLAHIGGFVAGVLMGLIARKQMKREPDTVLYRQYLRDEDQAQN